jgi:hypothetical protein
MTHLISVNTVGVHLSRLLPKKCLATTNRVSVVDRKARLRDMLWRVELFFPLMMSALPIYLFLMMMSDPPDRDVICTSAIRVVEASTSTFTAYTMNDLFFLFSCFEILMSDPPAFLHSRSHK